MSREFRVGRLAAVALIGALISEIWFRDRRDGGRDVAAVTKPNLPRHGSPVTGLGTGQTWGCDMRRRPSLPSSSRHRAGRRLNRLADSPVSRFGGRETGFLGRTCI
jgi:hypothetical protein